MGKPTGFMEYEHAEPGYEPAGERIVHYREFVQPLSAEDIGVQGARCMDCGIPFWHQGRPIHNIIPDWTRLQARHPLRHGLTYRPNSKRVQGVYVPDDDFISAEGKHVVVIGGGDTGSDCIGTSNRHGARSVTQIEILDKPPEKEDKGLTWPNWPNKLRTSSSQEEGCDRHWNVLTKSFEADEHGDVKALNYVLVRWDKDDNGRWQMSEV